MKEIQTLDLLFLAAVAGYLIYRLYAVLGTRKGFQRPTGDGGADVVPLRARSGKDEGDKLAKTFSKMSQLDPNFEINSFVGGAREAFEMILQAFQEGDIDTLNSLLNDTLLHNFKRDIKKRERAGETLEIILERVRSVEVIDASIRSSKAKIKVVFVSEQVPILRDSAGEIVEGDPDQIEVITDKWTFARDMSSPDPNWRLVSVSGKEDA